ncbi:flagellar hook protein FlgE [Sphaerotilus hippei]|uniref:Flagellar hook protein FlgE n=1 Tax=Sphaerotilus hippei TaxID=744406 RepID=A0A318H7F4_9BURK|nr:flagellar hook protein FlgE [Sphaerotilus hippei]PXW93704.1 flagellar hook protein FlgE [Sphaerotilus hippei]
MNFQSGLSGLQATSKNLDVIGNNVANSGTYGAKSSRAEFADLYANAMNGAGSGSVGIGVTVANIAQQFTQGTITSTENPLDLAINGSGFFQVKDSAGSISYTRNGQFKLDKSGYIVNNAGQQLQGYKANASGEIIQGAATALQLPTAPIAPKFTEEVAMEFNLDSRGDATQTSTPAVIDFDDPNTYNNATSTTVYDQQGNPVSLSMYYQKSTTANTWNVYVTADGTSLSGTSPYTTMEFAADGTTPTIPAAGQFLNIPASATGAHQAISNIALDMSQATQYGAKFSVTDLTQDGYAPGSLSSLSIDDTGVISANYSNGLTKDAGQLELATFRNPQGLQAVGGNVWVQTYASGDPVVGTPTSGTMGSLQEGSLEESNVDLTGELVNMITAQRAYQANAQTIKTQDSVLQTLVSLR